jgi:hypothetical protein
MKSTLFILFILISFLGYSQDKIVKTNGEEIFCQITKIGSDSITYITPFKDATRINYYIARSQVKKYYLNVNEGPKNNEYTDYVKEFDEPKMEKIKPILVDRPKFTVGVNGGFSYLLAPIGETSSSEEKDFYKDLKTGSHYGGDAYYFFNNWIGVGAKFSSFSTKSSIEGSFIFSNGVTRTGILYDKIKNTYVGPCFAFRFFPRKKNSAITITQSLGYFSHNRKAHYDVPQTLKGSTVGAAMGVAYDFQLEKHIYLTFKLELIAGSLATAELETAGRKETIEYPIDQQENLSRVDLSIGLRFGK